MIFMAVNQRTTNKRFPRKGSTQMSTATASASIAGNAKRHVAGNGRSRSWVIVYTGEGKGKTTASLGMALRAVGYDLKVCMIQFVKGSWPSGELKSSRLLAPNFRIIRAGKGFVGIIDDKRPVSEHIAAAKEALRKSEAVISSGRYDIVILDEINYAVNRKLIGVGAVLRLIRRRPVHVNLVLTGRGAPQRVIDAADLVTDMRKIKHPYDRGMTARKGIDF
jgi:cob(I)alamin adenosyltransferase